MLGIGFLLLGQIYIAESHLPVYDFTHFSSHLFVCQNQFPPRELPTMTMRKAERATVGRQPPVQDQPLDVVVLIAFEGADAVDMNILAWACGNREHPDHTSGRKRNHGFDTS